MDNWQFKHSIFTKANKEKAWAFWSDINNHAKMETGKARIELDGPFASGTRGRTVTGEYIQEWMLTEVIEGDRFVITGITPDGNGKLSFAWDFEDEGNGTRMTQTIEAAGPQVEEYLDVFHEIEVSAPKNVLQLAAGLDRFAGESIYPGF